MTPTSVDRTYWAGDVLVVGAGCAGALIANELRDQTSVTVIDQDAFGAAQSNHSHGYLHEGYVYRAGEHTLVDALRRGNRAWRRLCAELGVRPLHSAGLIGFTNDLTSRAAASAWHGAQLDVDMVSPHDAPEGVRAAELEALYATREWCVDMTEVFGVLRSRLGESALKAQALALIGDGTRVDGVVARLGGRRVLLQARQYVVAAGLGNAALAESVTGYRGRAVGRMSYMAVLKGHRLPQLNIVFPENETHGLFLVSRCADDGDGVWLVSNFVSFAQSREGWRRPDLPQRQLWLAALVEKLAALTTVVRDSTLEWGIYGAPKAELRHAPNLPSGYGVEDYNVENLMVVAPTKLTLAPTLSQHVADSIVERLGDLVPGTPRAPELGSAPSLGVRGERWRRARLRPRDRFFLNEDLDRSLNLLRRTPRARSPVVPLV